MTADKLGRRMHHHVGAEFNGTQQIRGGKGIVHNQGKAVAVGNAGHRLDVDEIDAGIADGLDIQRLGLAGDGGFKVFGSSGFTKTVRMPSFAKVDLNKAKVPP